MRIALLISCGIMVASCSPKDGGVSMLPAYLSHSAYANGRATTGYEVLYSFKGGADGAYPEAPLVEVNGTLYGTTSGGGSTGAGTIFKLTRSGKETVLYTFGSDGYSPLGLIDMNGSLYGTTFGDSEDWLVGSLEVGESEAGGVHQPLLKIAPLQSFVTNL